MSTKSMFLQFFTLTVASGPSIIFHGSNPVVVETGKNITMQWSISLTAGFSIRDIDAFVQSRSINRTQIVNSGGGKPAVFSDGTKVYGNRLKTDLDDNNFTLIIFNAKYSDSGNYSAVVLSQPLKEASKSATVNVHGGPEFYGPNVTSVKRPISELKFALKGNPPPVVTWGLKKTETNRSTKLVSRSGKEWYIHDYSLNYTEEICGRTLYFKAEVQNRTLLTWEQKHDVNFTRQVVQLSKPVTHNKNETTITWYHVNLSCDGVSHEYFLNFTRNDLLVLTGNTTSNSFSCGSECENATKFFIWAVVDGKRWHEMRYDLSPKGTTNSGNDGGNGGGNGGGGTKKKDHSLFVYVLIGLIVLAAILLAFIMIKIRRRKLRKSGQSSSETELELNNCTEEYGAEKSDDHSYDDIRAIKTPEKASDYENVPQNNKGDTANYINVNNLQEQEEKFPLYEAACGASAQYAKVDKTKKNEVQQYAQVDKTKKKEIQQYAVVDKSTNSAKNNKPLYAQVNKILKRNSNNYETVGDPNEKSHYADIETSSTNRPRKMEKVETNYVEVAIRDDPYDEPPPKHK